MGKPVFPSKILTAESCYQMLLAQHLSNFFLPKHILYSLQAINRRQKKKAGRRNSTIGCVAIKIWGSRVLYSRSDGVLVTGKENQTFRCSMLLQHVPQSSFNTLHWCSMSYLSIYSCKQSTSLHNLTKTHLCYINTKFWGEEMGRQLLNISFLRLILILKILRTL